MSMKFAAVLVGAALAISGCAVGSENSPVDEVNRGIKVPSAGFTAQEQEYLHDVGNHMTSALNSEPQSDVVNLGRSVCIAFDRGFTFVDVFSTINGNLSQKDTQVVIAAALVNFCPEHNDVLDSATST